MCPSPSSSESVLTDILDPAPARVAIVVLDLEETFLEHVVAEGVDLDSDLDLDLEESFLDDVAAKGVELDSDLELGLGESFLEEITTGDEAVIGSVTCWICDAEGKVTAYAVGDQ